MFYDNLAGGTPSIADTSSRQLHSDKRRNVSAIFSLKHVTAMEPKVQISVRKLLHAIKCKSHGQMVSTSDRYASAEGGEFDLRPWMNMFSFDAFSNMMWSSSYNFLDRGNDSCFSMDAEGKVTTVNAMDSFQTGVHFSVMCAQFTPMVYHLSRWLAQPTFRRQAADKFTGMARYKTVERVKSASQEPDFFTHLPYQPSEKAHRMMELPELVAECTTYLNAGGNGSAVFTEQCLLSTGNDTTQISLTNNIFEIASHPEKQEKLYQALITGLTEDSRPVASYSELSQIPYLRACIDETFRLLPPVRFGLPRRTVVEGATISGHFIPAGVTVSSSVHTLHRQSSLFHSPLEWKPERWLPDGGEVSEAERNNLKDYVLPFTLGGRACIGRNLAFMELSICLAAMVMGFKWTITPDSRKSFSHYERFNSSPLRLKVTAKARQDDALTHSVPCRV